MVKLFEKKPDVTKRRLSKDYIEFLLQEQKSRELRNWYEKYCNYAEKKLKLKPPQKLEEKLKENIIFASINVTPTGVFSAAIMSMMVSSVLFFLLAFVRDVSALIFLAALPIISLWYIFTYPSFMAQVQKVQAGDEAVKIILYMVIYLKLNPSFENAANFAASHTHGPITDDIKKAMWDLEIGKYKNVEEALGKYTLKWAIWNEEFIRSISLLYGILVEPSEEGREQILRKSLTYILDSTQSKMKKYVEDVSGPLNIIHTMGLTLPAIGLIMFPMVSIFLHQSISITQIIFAYVVLLPLINVFMIYRVLLRRPGAFLAPDISEHPELTPESYFSLKLFGKKRLIPVYIFAIIVGLSIMLYGILHFTDLFVKMATLPEIEKTELIKREAETQDLSIMIPNLLSSFSIVVGLAVMLIIIFYFRSFQRTKVREEIKTVENDFRIGLFSLGNFLNEGYPIEVCLQKSLEEYQKLGMQNRPIYKFFYKLYQNLKNLGMTFKLALTDKENGVLRYYPSVLIKEIMNILMDAADKSAVLLGTISKTIAVYLDNLNVVEEKIRELLEETRSSIKMQASFVIPLVLGIIGALGMFVIGVLKILSGYLATFEESFSMIGSEGSVSGMLNVLVGNFSEVIPMTLLQTVIGIYTIELICILSYLLSGIEHGFDKVARDYEIAHSLMRGMLMYVVISIVALAVFSALTLSFQIAM